MKKVFSRIAMGAVLGACVPAAVLAAPYASNLTVSGTTVSFILNEAADSVSYSINGGLAISLATTTGSQSFFLDSPSDSFSIEARKLSYVGWINPSGGSTGSNSNGLSQSTRNGTFTLISSDTNPLGRFNNPRGVTVNVSPNTPDFGTAYISNTGTIGANYSVAAGSGGIGNSAARSLVTKGMYALRADQTDAFGYANAGQNTTWANSTSTPYKPAVAPDGTLYISDFSDASGTVWRMTSALAGGTAVFSGTGPGTVPIGQYHGSVTTVWVTGTGSATTLYTIDEDLTPAGVPGAVSTSTTSKLNVWAYALGTNSLPYASPPTLVNPSPVLVNSTNNVVRGADGKYYVSQNRTSPNAQAGILVLDATTGTTVFSSLTASRALLSNTSALDIFTNTMGIAVSPDQKWLAAMLNNSDVAVMPLIDGIPDIASRLLIDTGTDINSGRDIAFDAANNIHYVSSGQQIYRVLATGGETIATTSYSGGVTSFTMVMAVPEPSTVALAATGAAGAALVWRRRRRCGRSREWSAEA